MSKKLEQTIAELSEQREIKQAIEKAEYRVNKQFDEKYANALSMLQEGDKVPKKSKYFAQAVREQRGYVSNAYVVALIQRDHPRLRREIEDYKEQCRVELVDRIQYGKK